MRLVLRAAACAAAALIVAGATAGQQSVAATGGVVVSQVYGGGGNSGATWKNDFVELHNTGSTAIDVTGWTVQYASSSGSSWQKTPLTGTIPGGGYYLVQEAMGSGGTVALPTADAPGSISMSATAGKVALVDNATTLTGTCPTAGVVDFVGFGSANCSETAPAPAPSNTTAVLRANGGCTDTGSNASDFTVAPPTPRNGASPPQVCNGGSVVLSCGSPVEVPSGLGADVTVTASDTDGTVGTIDVGSVTPSPSAGTIARTSLTPAAETGGTATATVHVGATVPAGGYAVSITAANGDDPQQVGSCSLPVSVTAPVVVLPIGTVQGTGDASPYIGQTVTVDGVVTEKTYDSSSGHGFFLQSTPGTGDADTATSDGIWVYLGGYTTLIGGYTPVVGDEIAMSGKVSEYYDQTEIGSARLVSVVAHDQSVDPFVADPPAETAAAHEYWESHEGMLALVPEGSLVDSPRHIYASSSDSEFYVIRSDTTVGQRSDPFARRVFRDAHPLDDLPPLVDNGNAYSILITDAGVKALTGDLGTFLPPVRTFDTLSADLLGGVSYAYGSYSVAASGQPQVADGVDPSTNAPPTAFDRAKAYSIANYNVENLYDYRDDPTDGCDFAGNAGCTNVLPPFDYVPASDAEYQSRLAKIAHQVVDDLHAPDVIAVAEAEDQDICTVRDGALACDASDGKPDVLQELATRIAEFGGPAYDAAFDRDGADDRGIVSAFLYRTDRVQLLPAFSGPDVQYRGDPLPYDADVQNPKAMNAVLPSDVDTSTGVDGSNVYTRAPEVGHFRIWRTAVGLSEYRDVWVIADHFSSTPDARVGQRREQAAYNAAIEQAILAAEPGAKVAVAGDLNVYPRPDDTAPPSDQLAPLYDAGMHNLFDTLVELHPSSAYSYVYMGQAQTLDQQFDSPALFADLLAVNVAHVNSDWSLAEGNRGTSDHDPMVARYDGRATLAGLRQLVLFYAGSGQLNALAERGLLDRLDRAAAFRAAGLLIPYATQLRSFAQDATHGVPGQIDPAAGAALAAEAAAVLAG